MSEGTFVLNPADLEALIVGGCFFGSGGGGTLTSARSLLQHFCVGDYYGTDRVHVVPVEAVTKGDAVVVAYMGAPVKLNTATYPVGPSNAVDKVRQRLARQGRQLEYIVPPESGALGFLVACLVAAKYGLAVVDADGAGRAVPSLPMLTFASEDVPPYPAFVASEHLAVELDVESIERKVPEPQIKRLSVAHQTKEMSTIVEHMLRPIISEPQFGQVGGLATWIMDPLLLNKALKVRGTLSRALELGKAILGGEIESSARLLDFLAEHGLQGFSLFSGGLDAASLSSVGGFDLGRIEIAREQRRAISLYQNESLVAWDSDLSHPLAMAPDSIAYFLESHPQRVASNGDLVAADGSLNPEFRGAKVSLIGVAAHPSLRVPRGSAEEEGLILRSFMAQLQSMGYQGAYVPVEKLRAEAGEGRR